MRKYIYDYYNLTREQVIADIMHNPVTFETNAKAIDALRKFYFVNYDVNISPYRIFMDRVHDYALDMEVWDIVFQRGNHDPIEKSGRLQHLAYIVDIDDFLRKENRKQKRG